MFEAIVAGLIANGISHLTIEAIRKALQYAVANRPGLAARAAAAEASGNTVDIERVFREAVGVIDAAAASGLIEVQAETVIALKGIRFDHQHGRVQMANTTVSAPIIVTGGGFGATGETRIGGNTELRSQGTSISVGQGAGIIMTGGATIKQT